MAQFVNIKISIDGKEVEQVSSFSLSQGIYRHHSFQVICPTEGLDGTSGSIFNSSKDLIGSSITIQVDAAAEGSHSVSNGSLKFSGVITQLESDRSSGHVGNIIISGFSPTILMDNGMHCKSWEKKALKNIATDVVGHFPQNLLQPKISPAYGDTFSYMVQYNESAWQFLSRICATYGEWLYYDGQKLILAAPQGKKIDLEYGVELQHFSMALQLQPPMFQLKSYDYINDQVYEGTPSDDGSKAGLNNWGKHTLQKSKSFYDTKPKQWHNQFLTNKKQLDDYVNARASSMSSNMVRFSGKSGHPGLAVGGTAHITGSDVYSKSSETYGDFTILSVNHYCDGQGHYSNDFVAIPSSNKMPPLRGVPEVHCETQSALVTDNNDSDGLGRIRVRFRWMDTDEKSPWLRIAGFHGGSGKGSFFIPEVGEEVIIGFEDDSPTKPFVIGTVFNGSAKTDYSNDGNDMKVIRTRSGNHIVMNDKDGSVTVVDQKDNKIQLDGSGNINITSSDSIVLTSGSSSLSLKKDGTIELTGKNITVKADQKATMASGQATFTADGQANGAKVEGMTTSMSGTQSAEVKGGAQTNVSASGQVAVKGAMIMLN